MISLLESLNVFNNFYLYHFISGGYELLNSIKKYGLCSPRKLYEVDKDLFNKYTFEIYKQRASTVMDIPLNKVTPEIVLDFLDSSPKRFGLINSNAIFFSLFPINEYGKQIQEIMSPGLQLKINSKFLYKYTPILVDGKLLKNITWNEMTNNDFINNIKQQVQKHSNNYYNLAFKHIPHIAVNCYYIPYNIIDEVKII